MASQKSACKTAKVKEKIKMARGEDTRNHPGRRIYRPTPRVAGIVESHLNQKIEDAQEHLFGDQPLLGYTMGGQAQYVDEGAGQHVLDRYRQGRDSMQTDPPARGFEREVRQDRINDEAGNIKEALTAHREGWLR